MNKISVIIPTLQKNKELLINLLDTLDKDLMVDEIILIDNSLQGLDYTSPKLNIIIPKENLYVNPSWNLGVKTAKNKNIALLNDDITIPINFCSKVFEKITDDIGVVGCDVNFVQNTQEILPLPNLSNISLEKRYERCLNQGIAIFFTKDNFVEIPSDLKIFYGDDWLIYQCKKHKKKIANICGQKIYHYGSLSSSKLCKYIDAEKQIYKNYTVRWWHHLYNFKKLDNGVLIILFGIRIKIRNSNK